MRRDSIIQIGKYVLGSALNSYNLIITVTFLFESCVLSPHVIDKVKSHARGVFVKDTEQIIRKA